MRKLQKALAYLLAFGMMISLLPVQARAADEPGATTIYFLNSEHWATVGVHAWNDSGNLTGDWGTTAAASDPDLGGDWVKATIPADPTFAIIIFNKDSDGERATLDITDAEHVYVISTGAAFTTPAAAEEAAEEAAAGIHTTIYFLNWDGENTAFDGDIYAYAYADDEPVGPGWPGTQAEKANGMGEDWWKVELTANDSKTPFNVIFNNNSGNQLSEVYITDYEDNYVTARAELYPSQAAAERSVGIENEETGTVVHFLNSDHWETVGVHAWNDSGDLTGSWGSTTAAPDQELGGDWVKATIPADPTFAIIIFNLDNGDERATLDIGDTEHVYGISTGAA